VKLKSRSLDAVGAPGLYLVAGSVDHARFVLPWARLGAKPVKAEIRGVALRVRATADDDVITTAVEGSAAERRRELDLLEAVRAHWTALAEQTTDDKTTSLSRRLLAKLASRVAVDINDVSVSFGDTKASATHVWARDDEKASPRRILGAAVGVSLSVGERIVFGPIDADATADARCLMPNQRPPPEGFPLVEPPKKGRAAWVVRLRCDALRVDGPIVSTEEVLNALDAVRIAATRVALRDFPAPKPVATNAKAWWRRAYAYALRECRKGREDRWANAIRLLRMRRAYIPLYARAVAPPRLRAQFPRLNGNEENRLADLEAVAPTLAVLAFRDAARAVLRARDDGTTDDVHSAARKAAAALTFQAPAAPAEVECTQLCCVLVDVGCTSARSDIDRLLLRLDVDKAGGRRWTGLARGSGTELVRVAASEAGIAAMAAPLDLRLREGDLGCVPRIANVVARLPRSAGPAPAVDAALAGLTIGDVLAAGRVAFKDGILIAESIRCGASSVAGLRVDTNGHTASATTARLAWTPSLVEISSLLPAGSSTTDNEWFISVDDASVAWEIPGGAAEIKIKGATATGSSTTWSLGCRHADFSVNNDAPVRLTAPATCSLRVDGEVVLDFGPIAVQTRPAESAALIRCVCGLDALAAPARADVTLRASAPKVTVATAPDRGSWRGLADVRLDDEAVAAAEPVVMIVEAVEVSVTSSADTLAVSATAGGAEVSGAVVSDISVQATNDTVVARAARADIDVDGRALASLIEVTSAIENGFACRSWDYLGVSRAVVEGEAVDFFAVGTERTASISVDAVSINWNGVRFRGHVSSDGVSCSAVLEAARNGAQLLEPTLVQITADGVSLTNATDADAPIEVYAAPSDIRSIIDAVDELALDGGGAFALRASKLRFYATGTRLPAFLAAASDVCLDARQGTTALTCSLTRLDAYDATSGQSYRCVLQKPVNVCAQMTDGTLRVALGDLGLSVDDATVASISRILAAREAAETPPLQVRNETGAPLLVDGVSVEANAVATLSVDTKPRADRLGRARDGSPVAPLEVLADAYAASLPLDRRSLYGPGDGLRPLGAVTSSDFVVGEYTYQDGSPVLRLRTRIRVENRCDREMALQVAGSAYQRDLPAVAPHTTFDLPLAIVREAPLDAVVCVQIDERWRPVANFEKLRAIGSRRGYERVHWVDAPARCFLLSSAVANTVVVCPPVALKSSLTLRARIATARRLPETRQDYAENCSVLPNEAETSALYENATHWCLRVDGIEAQSAWVPSRVEINPCVRCRRAGVASMAWLT
jgi:hypothetical protein